MVQSRNAELEVKIEVNIPLDIINDDDEDLLRSRTD
jgi:hypothetical protein